MTPKEILETIAKKAEANLGSSVITDSAIKEKIEFVCKCLSNRAGVRLLMACMLGKLDSPTVDPRNPYTEIGSDNCFSGRTYDERYLSPFINKHRLPCNPTTAFLTPTLRNINKPLTTDIELVGRPRELYIKTLQLLEDVALGRVGAEAVLIEAVSILIDVRNENLKRMGSLLKSLQEGSGALPLSSEGIVTVVEQHLACKNASRLPVLVVAAAYNTAGNLLGEYILPLNSHNAADLQTGALGDIEICLESESAVVTCYEMKMKRVTMEDINTSISKIARASNKIHNYIFITTDGIDPEVMDYAKSLYEETGGTEITILSCIGFLRHFLHLFHRIRTSYLDHYQALVLAEPDSAVSQTLKETFLALRKAAETGE